MLYEKKMKISCPCFQPRIVIFLHISTVVTIWFNKAVAVRRFTDECWHFCPTIFLINGLQAYTYSAALYYNLVAGPTSRNSLPARLRDPTLSSDSFRWNNLKRNDLRVIKHTKRSSDASWFCAVYTFTIDIDTSSKNRHHFFVCH